MRAQSTYDQARSSDLAYAQANIEKSKANAQLGQADLGRYRPLMEKGEISKQQFDAGTGKCRRHSQRVESRPGKTGTGATRR